MAQGGSVDMQLGRAALNKEAEATRLPNTRTTAPLSSSETPRVTDMMSPLSLWTMVHGLITIRLYYM